MITTSLTCNAVNRNIYGHVPHFVMRSSGVLSDLSSGVLNMWNILWSVSRCTQHMRCTLWSFQVYLSHMRCPMVYVQGYSIYEVSSVVCPSVLNTWGVLCGLSKCTQHMKWTLWSVSKCTQHMMCPLWSVSKCIQHMRCPLWSVSRCTQHVVICYLERFPMDWHLLNCCYTAKI